MARKKLRVIAKGPQFVDYWSNQLIKVAKPTSKDDLKIRGGASAHDAILAFQESGADYAILSGRDFLKSDFQNQKEKRAELMKLHGAHNILDVYAQLVPHFLKCFGLDQEEWNQACDLLFKNYLKTFERQNPPPLLDEKWFRKLNTYFRGVDPFVTKKE